MIETIPKRGYSLVAQVTGFVSRPDTDLRSFKLAGATLRAILRSCTDHIYVYDREQRFLMVSDAAARALGIGAVEMVGRTWRELGMPAEIMEPLFVLISSVFDGGPSVREHASYPTIEGSRDYEYVLEPVRENSEVIAVLALVREL